MTNSWRKPKFCENGKQIGGILKCDLDKYLDGVVSLDRVLNMVEVNCNEEELGKVCLI